MNYFVKFKANRPRSLFTAIKRELDGNNYPFTKFTPNDPKGCNHTYCTTHMGATHLTLMFSDDILETYSRESKCAEIDAEINALHPFEMWASNISGKRYDDIHNLI